MVEMGQEAEATTLSNTIRSMSPNLEAKSSLRCRETDKELLDIDTDDAAVLSPYDFLIPYDASEDDDDDADWLSLPINCNFVDAGWDFECLQDAEDIDFEFVYALHTFVATVEGQANATKGDTMVLLDDSNSYWWLVRVVKDSSIGTLQHEPHSSENPSDPSCRVLTRGTHRDADREAGTSQQAQEHRCGLTQFCGGTGDR